jgi:hypothetical protein
MREAWSAFFLSCKLRRALFLCDVELLTAEEIEKRIAPSTYPFAMYQIAKGGPRGGCASSRYSIGSSLARGSGLARFDSSKEKSIFVSSLDDGCPDAAAVAGSHAVFMTARSASGGTWGGIRFFV